jgi:hypothetical protein
MKATYIGAPQCFQLELCCKQLKDAFCKEGICGIYLVGSSLERPTWRDIDVRLIMDDDSFAKLFPDAGQHWEHDSRWLIMTCSISKWLKEMTGLPIDFQFQPMSHANKRHKGLRSALGLHIVKE